MSGSIYKNFYYRKFRIDYQVLGSFRFSGSPYLLFRGIFGKILKDEVCVHKKFKTCAYCPKKKFCPYTDIFKINELKPGHPLFPKYKYPPVPYILYPDLGGRLQFDRGDLFSVDLTLIGRASEYDTFSIHALQQLSRDKGLLFRKLEYTGIETIVGDDKKSNLSLDGRSRSVAQLKLRFHSPFIINTDSAHKKYHLTFLKLVKNISERMNILNQLYCNGRATDLQPFLDEIPEVVTQDNFYPVKTAIKNNVDTDAFLGSVVYRNIPERYWPVVEAGAVLHLGRSTNYGYGKYTIDESY